MQTGLNNGRSVPTGNCNEAILSDKYFYYETYYISFGTKCFVIIFFFVLDADLYVIFMRTAASMTTETLKKCPQERAVLDRE